MSRIEISRQIEAPVSRAWEKLSDLASHDSWMRDAESVEFLSERRSGIGTRMRVPTRVGIFRTTDILEVVDWVDGQSIAVSHQGIFSGSGRFTLSGDEVETTITWTEDILFPWWVGGVVAAWFARPVLKLIWSGNLNRFGLQLSTE
ncbi:MAG TPA: SRPBCC family protein [Acidimicrobiia bacterium]